MNEVVICGQKFEPGITHFSFEWPFTQINDMRELSKLAYFPNLTSATFTGTNLDDFGLELVSNCTTIDNLSLQETQITNQGILHLKNLINLKYLRLKGNLQLDDRCILFLNHCSKLIDLQIHETNITETGLKQLHIPGLKNIIVAIDANNFSYDFLKKRSIEKPECSILAKGKGCFLNGNFEGNW